MQNYEIIPLFSKPLYISELNDVDFKKYLNIIKNFEWLFSGEKKDKSLSYVSNDRYILERKDFKTLKQKILKEFNVYKGQVLRFKNDFEITTSWLTLTDKNRYSILHNHTNCMFSGILYLNANENDGDLYFENVSDKRYYLIPEEYNVYNSHSQNIKPKTGKILFFPSEMYHQILKNNTKNNRVSLAFNLIPKGYIGKGDSYLKM